MVEILVGQKDSDKVRKDMEVLVKANDGIGIMLIGDLSIEHGGPLEGPYSIFVGKFIDGLPHGDGALLTKIPKHENYDGGRKTDQLFKQMGSDFTTSLLERMFQDAGVELHESELPFLSLKGGWNKGELVIGDAFQFDYEIGSAVLVYSGQWENNIPCGYGNILYPKEVYSGDVKFGQKHGSGTQKALDGGVIEGEWHEGLFHGFMKFKKVDGVRNEQEYYQGEKIGPYVQTTYEDEEKIFSTLFGDVEGISVYFLKSWCSEKPIQDYVAELKKGDAMSARRGSMAPQFSDKNWITDQSDYVVKDSEDKILGWVKREGKSNQDSSLTKAFIVFPDLGYFQGVVGDDLVPNGQGTYTFPGNFAKISGKWKNGEISEGGIYVSDRILYHGNFSNGQPTLDGEYYIHGNAGGMQQATSKQEKEELRPQLVDNVGSDVWSKEKNLIDWDSKFSKSLSSIISVLNLESKLSKIIEQPESEVLEFKSSVWAQYSNDSGELVDKQKSKSLALEDAVIKTIAAFLNTQGGKLIIGVQDKPKRKVVGIEADFQYSGKSKDIESFQNSLTNAIKTAANDSAIVGTYVEISIESVEGKSICVVDVKQKAPKSWTYVNMKNWKNKGQKKECFFVRSGPSSNIIDSRKSADEWKSARLEMYQYEEN
jgi:hypothetical protein